MRINWNKNCTYEPEYAYKQLSTGIKMAHVDMGAKSKTAVVLIHGATDSYLSWSQIAPILANAGHRVIVPELRGHGETDKPIEGPYTAEAHGEDIKALLESLEVNSAHLVGHSLGSFVSQWMAAYAPELVLSLTLIGSARTVAGNEALEWLLEGDGDFKGINHETQLSDAFLRNWTASTNDSAEFIEKTYEHAKGLPMYVWRNVFHGFPVPVGNLDKITAPVQLIWGTEDMFFSLDDQNALIDALLGAKVVFVEKEGLSHNAHWEGRAGEGIAKDILDFIA
jgi:pimeloyl-ACP methyl ester carboxylesterase